MCAQGSYSSSVINEIVDAGFPALHRERVEFNGGSWQAKFETAWKYVSRKDGAIIALVGPRGTGKTQMATELSKRICSLWLDKGFQSISKYYRLMDFFIALKDSYGGRTTQEDAIIPFARPRLLVLDEVQVRGDTAWEDNALTYLLDRRYGDRRSSILISNQSVPDFVKSIGDSIASRLEESGAIIVCDWDSFRSNKKGI